MLTFLLCMGHTLLCLCILHRFVVVDLVLVLVENWTLNIDVASAEIHPSLGVSMLGILAVDLLNDFTKLTS